jgi:hypothetical protein
MPLTLSDIASIIGMVTGISGFTLSIVNYLRDRAKLWVTVSPNMHTINVPEYDPNKTYMVTKVVNIGRRPVYVSMVAGLTSEGKSFLINDALRNPQKISEGDAPAQFLLDQAFLDDYRQTWPGIYLIVQTADGHQYGRFLDRKPEGFAGISRWRIRLLRLRTVWRHPWAMKWRHRPS